MFFCDLMVYNIAIVNYLQQYHSKKICDRM